MDNDNLEGWPPDDPKEFGIEKYYEKKAIEQNLEGIQRATAEEMNRYWWRYDEEASAAEKDYMERYTSGDLTDDEIRDLEIETNKFLSEESDNFKPLKKTQIKKAMGKVFSVLIDPVEEAVVATLSKLGLGAAGMAYVKYETANFIGNILLGAGAGSAQAQLAQSAILAEALGLDVDSEEYVEGLESKIVESTLAGVHRATKMSPSFKAEEYIYNAIKGFGK
jgi:hypothetical protein|tara:strand:+ start:9654 stop:10319 length:666 start_codon:yes stop_codon:yes gene_type:complete